MRRILILLFTILIGMVVGMNKAHAQTVAPTKTATPRAAQAKTPSPAPAAAKAPVPLTAGSVTEISATSITISQDSPGNVTKTFTLSEATRFEAPGIAAIKGKPTVKNIVTGDHAAVASQDGIYATLVVIAAKGAITPLKSQAFVGIVSSREATSSGTILSMKHPKNDAFKKALVSSTTGITAKGIEKATIDDIKASDKVIVAGNVDVKDMILARKVYLIPGKARSLLDRLSSPLASPKTASASAKASPTTPAKATATTKVSPTP